MKDNPPFFGRIRNRMFHNNILNLKLRTVSRKHHFTSRVRHRSKVCRLTWIDSWRFRACETSVRDKLILFVVCTIWRRGHALRKHAFLYAKTEGACFFPYLTYANSSSRSCIYYKSVVINIC